MIFVPLDEVSLHQLVDRWTYGWAAARALDVTATDGALCVNVDDVSRRLEYVVTSPDAKQFARLVAHTLGRVDVWLTVFAPSVAAYLALADDLEIAADDEVFMTRSIEAAPSTHGILIDADIDTVGVRADARLEIEGTLAAMGSVAVVYQDAIFDRIETMPRFQRRGLGSQIMYALSHWAHGQGATSGLLAASGDGRHLYGRLGWKLESQMISFRGRPLQKR